MPQRWNHMDPKNLTNKIQKPHKQCIQNQLQITLRPLLARLNNRESGVQSNYEVLLSDWHL
jgi:hypothetical protein